MLVFHLKVKCLNSAFWDFNLLIWHQWLGVSNYHQIWRLWVYQLITSTVALSRPRWRFPDNAKFGQFTLLFCRGGKKCTTIYIYNKGRVGTSRKTRLFFKIPLQLQVCHKFTHISTSRQKKILVSKLPASQWLGLFTFRYKKSRIFHGCTIDKFLLTWWLKAHPIKQP